MDAMDPLNNQELGLEHILPEHERIRVTIHALPVLTKDQVNLEDSCAICLTPFASIFEEAEQDAQNPNGKQEDNEDDEEVFPVCGVTKIVQCGHIFCRRDMTEWIKSFHGSCPACRHPFLDIRPPSESDDESSDGGEYVPDEEEFEDEDETVYSDAVSAADIEFLNDVVLTEHYLDQEPPALSTEARRVTYMERITAALMAGDNFPGPSRLEGDIEVAGRVWHGLGNGLDFERMKDMDELSRGQDSDPDFAGMEEEVDALRWDLEKGEPSFVRSPRTAERPVENGNNAGVSGLAYVLTGDPYFTGLEDEDDEDDDDYQDDHMDEDDNSEYGLTDGDSEYMSSEPDFAMDDGDDIAVSVHEGNEDIGEGEYKGVLIGTTGDLALAAEEAK